MTRRRSFSVFHLCPETEIYTHPETRRGVSSFFARKFKSQRPFLPSRFLSFFLFVGRSVDGVQYMGMSMRTALWRLTGKKTVLFEPFMYKNYLFTKTGSGQT
jgi:hypothetical protein